MELFVPEKFIEARRKLQADHAAGNADLPGEFTPRTEDLINRLYQVPPEMNRAAAAALSEQELDLLAGYLPYNYLEKDQSKLFDIFRCRLDRRSGEVLFQQWQDAYTNRECNNFLKTIVVSNSAFQKVLAQYHIEEDRFLKILDSYHIPLSFDEELVESHFADGVDFDTKLKYYGVVEGSYLDIECKRALLTCCARADYFNCSEENILEIIQSYDTYMLRKFLVNFMSKMSLGELQAYPELAAWLRRVIGHRRSDTFREFFRDVDSDSVQKFLDWINIFKINLFFENDDRSRFWKQYRYLNVIRYPVCDTVILEFERYIAVEFLGEKKGTIYISDKEIFRENFYPQLNRMNNEDLRTYFKIRKDLCTEYRNHTGRWQTHVGNVISKKNIAEKIRF